MTARAATAPVEPRSAQTPGEVHPSLSPAASHSVFRRVLGNAGWNLLATVLPLFAAVAAMPWLAQRLGTERLGLLTLAWVLVGYFGLFEFGVGRALTRFVAERVGREEGSHSAAELPQLCSTASAMALGAGLLGSGVMVALALWPGLWLERVPSALQAEARSALWWMALGIPATVATAALRGLLEGLQRFKLLMVIRVPAGVLMFAAPCASAVFTPRLDAALAAIVLARWAVLLAHWLPSRAAVAMSWQQVQRQWVAPLLQMGGWLTVSSIVSPVIVFADRFVIGGLVSATALAYYAAPFEMVARLLVLPVALAGALYPALAAAQRAPAGPPPDALASDGHQQWQQQQRHQQQQQQQQHQRRRLGRQALALTAATVLPLAVAGMLWAPQLLQAWMGPEFAQAGTAMRVLLLGFVFNALAHVPYTALHSQGFAKHTALLHLLELPLYLLLLVTLVRQQGIEGAATAWALRAAFDLAALLLLQRHLGQRPAATTKASA